MRAYPHVYLLRRYPFAFAPFLIALTLLLNAAFAQLKPQRPPLSPALAAIEWPHP